MLFSHTSGLMGEILTQLHISSESQSKDLKCFAKQSYFLIFLIFSLMKGEGETSIRKRNIDHLPPLHALNRPKQ